MRTVLICILLVSIFPLFLCFTGTAFFNPALLGYDFNSLALVRTAFWIVIVVAVTWVSLAAFLQSIAGVSTAPGGRRDLRDLGVLPKVDIVVPLLSNTLFFTIGTQRFSCPTLQSCACFGV